MVSTFLGRDTPLAINTGSIRDQYGIEYQVKLQIVSLSLQIAGFGETPVSPFLQIGIKVFANPVSTFLQI
jgi:hypothetical protein